MTRIHTSKLDMTQASNVGNRNCQQMFPTRAFTYVVKDRPSESTLQVPVCPLPSRQCSYFPSEAHAAVAAT